MSFFLTSRDHIFLQLLCELLIFSKEGQENQCDWTLSPANFIHCKLKTMHSLLKALVPNQYSCCPHLVYSWDLTRCQNREYSCVYIGRLDKAPFPTNTRGQMCSHNSQKETKYPNLGLFKTPGQWSVCFLPWACSVQLLSRLGDPMDYSTPDFLSITNSLSLFKLMSIESVMPSNHLIPLGPSSPALKLSQHQDLFQWVSSSHQVAKVLELQL